MNIWHQHEVIVLQAVLVAGHSTEVVLVHDVLSHWWQRSSSAEKWTNSFIAFSSLPLFMLFFYTDRIGMAKLENNREVRVARWHLKQFSSTTRGHLGLLDQIYTFKTLLFSLFFLVAKSSLSHLLIIIYNMLLHLKNIYLFILSIFRYVCEYTLHLCDQTIALGLLVVIFINY